MSKVLGFLAIVAAVAVLALTIAQHMRRDDVQRAAVDTMRVIVHQRDTVRDTIRVRERAKARVDSVCCEIVTDTLIVIQPSPSAAPETVTVRAPVVERLRADAALLVSLYEDRRLDSLWHIQDAKLPHKPPSRYSLGLTAGYACTSKGCGPGVSVGLSIRLP